MAFDNHTAQLKARGLTESHANKLLFNQHFSIDHVSDRYIFYNQEKIHQINEDNGKNSSNEEESEVMVENNTLSTKLGELKKNGYKVSQLEEGEENIIEPTSPEKDDEKKK